MLLQEIANKISSHTNWKQKTPVDNTVTFTLDDGLVLNIYSPEGSTIILHSTITELSGDDYSNKQLMQKAGQLSVATVKTKKTIVAVKDNALILHRTVLQQNEIIEDTKSFLNDLAWWKKNLKY